MFDKPKNQVFNDTLRNILQTWHRMDLINDRKISMNEVIFSKQKNHNYYIDHSE